MTKSSIRFSSLVDDHGLWDPERQDGQDQSRRQDQKWQDLSGKTQTGLETVLSDKGTGGEAVLEQVRVAVRDDVDYRAFLRRFAAPREVRPECSAPPRRS